MDNVEDFESKWIKVPARQTKTEMFLIDQSYSTMNTET